MVYFTLRNPGLSQPSPDISVGAMSAATVVQEGGIELPKVQVPAVLVEKSSAAVLGVESGTTPLFIVDMFFLDKNISQSTPLASVRNTITVQMSTSFTVFSSFGARVTISGLLGATYTGLSSTCDSSDEWRVEYVDWDASRGDLIVQLCDGNDILPGIVNTFSYVVTNRDENQEPTPMMISMSSSQFPDFLPQEMDRPGLKKDGVSRFTDPPLVVTPVLLQKDIRQNVPFVNKINTIYVTVMSNVDTSGNITVMGLKNAIAESGPLCFSVQGDLAGPVGKECYEEGSIPSWAGQCKSATWDARLFQAHFTGCTLLSREPLMLSFDVLNPSFSQQSPEVQSFFHL